MYNFINFLRTNFWVIRCKECTRSAFSFDISIKIEKLSILCHFFQAKCILKSHEWYSNDMLML